MNYKYLGMIALFVLGAVTFAACSSDDDVVEPTPQTSSATGKYTMTITASKGDVTRGLRPGKDNDNWNIIETYWTAGETVDVIQSGTFLGTLTATPVPDDDTQATLTGTLEVAPTTGDYAPYLYFYLHGCDRSYTGQIGTLADIAANHDYDRQYLAMNCITVDEDNKTITSNYTVQFANSMQNIVKFFLYKADGTTPLSAKILNIHDGQNGLVKAWNNLTSSGSYGDVTINLSSATNEIYAALDFYKSPADLTLTAFDGTDYYTYTKNGVTAFNTFGKYFEIAVKMTPTALVKPSITWTSVENNAAVEPDMYNRYRVWGPRNSGHYDPSEITISGISTGYYFSMEFGSTITLDGLTATYDGNNGNEFICSLGGDLNLIVNGTNTITCKNHLQCISAGGNLKLSGNGTLTVTANYVPRYGLYANNYKDDNPATNTDASVLAAEGYTVSRSGVTNNGDGTYTWTYTIAPAPAYYAATTNDIGRVIGSDGNIYASKTAAEAVNGVAAVAMIAYVGTASNCAHGLAIALENVGNGNTWDSAAGLCNAWNTSKTVTGGTWRLPSIVDWQYMFVGCGTDGPVNENPTAGSYSMSYSGLASKLETAGGEGAALPSSLWSKDDGDTNHWYISFDSNSKSATFRKSTSSGTCPVRACLAF